MSRRKIAGIIIAVIIILSLPLLFVARVYLAFNGGIAGIIRDLTPSPDFTSPAMVDKRVAAKAAIEAAFGDVGGMMNFAVHVHATSVHDRCHKASYDWKRGTWDNYHNRCELRVTHFYGFDGNFRKQMIELERSLKAQGWELPSWSIQAAMAEDDRQRKSGGIHVDSSLLAPPGAYNKNRLVLEIQWVPKGIGNISLIESAQEVTTRYKAGTYDQREFQDVKSIYRKITQDHEYILAISIQQSYFEDK